MMLLLETILLFYGLMIQRCDSSCSNITLVHYGSLNNSQNERCCCYSNVVIQTGGLKPSKVEILRAKYNYVLARKNDTLCENNYTQTKDLFEWEDFNHTDLLLCDSSCSKNRVIIGLNETKLTNLCGKQLPEGIQLIIHDSVCDTKPGVSIKLPVPAGENLDAEQAANLLNNLRSVVEQMGNSKTAELTAGEVKGIIARLPTENQTTMSFSRNRFGSVGTSQGTEGPNTKHTQSIKIPAETIKMGVDGNSSFVAVVFFPGTQLDPHSGTFLHNQIVGIEMGTRIANLSEPIIIDFHGVEKNGNNLSCNSWDGEGGAAVWVTDGCETEETNSSITCLCFHLTFFAILISPPNKAVNGSLSQADLQRLTTITSIGCGLSLFFQLVALTMHCLIRKRKSSLETKILMQLFVAMFTMNLSFLVNETIAGLGNAAACVSIAAVLHYSLLATFTWFSMQALHLFLKFKRTTSEIKHYLKKIYITGWVIPGLAVSMLLILQKYELLHISTKEGTQMNMCWIADAVVQQGVNIGYYSVVFAFTFSIFIIIARQISLLSSAVQGDSKKWSIKIKVLSVLTLFILLGLTWAFAFFCHGPLTLTCYYIFTILNSFQGLLLFIYYYKFSKISGDDVSHSSTRSTTTSTAQTDVTTVDKVYAN